MAVKVTTAVHHYSKIFIVSHSDEVWDKAMTSPILHLYNKRRYVCLSVCVYVPYGRPNGWADRDQTWHTHSSTQGVFLTRSTSRSFMYACGNDRITKHPERCAKATPGERCSNYVRRTGEATTGERLQNSAQMTGNYSSSNEARRGTAGAARRTQSGGRVITASIH